MTDYEILFAISHLKKAIWNLECVNKLKPDTINSDLIDDLKADLILLKNNDEKVFEK